MKGKICDNRLSWVTKRQHFDHSLSASQAAKRSLLAADCLLLSEESVCVSLREQGNCVADLLLFDDSQSDSKNAVSPSLPSLVRERESAH